MSHFCMPSLPVVKSERRLSVTVQELVIKWAFRQIGL